MRTSEDLGYWDNEHNYCEDCNSDSCICANLENEFEAQRGN